MGWSCSKVANDTLEDLTKICIEQTESQNLFNHKGKQYIFETSRREYSDGSITGSILEVNGNYAKKVENFRIDGTTGEITRGSKLKQLIKHR